VVAGFPAASARLSVGGLELAYVDAGAGPPVVLVHGNPTWSYYYRDLIAALPPAGYRALAPDHIGMGRSAKPSAADYPHTLSRRVADFAAFLDAVVPTEPVTLVVHDWGGAIALAWAVQHPERVARLVLLNTAAFPMPAGKRLPLPLQAVRTAPGAAAVLRANAFVRGATRLAVRRPLPAAVRAGYLAPYDRPEHRVGVLEFVRDLPVRPTDPAHRLLARTAAGLARLADVPTLVCWGMRDFILDGDYLAEVERLLPGAEVHRFPDAGHWVLDDEPDAVRSLVLNFLARTPSQPPARAAGPGPATP